MKKKKNSIIFITQTDTKIPFGSMIHSIDKWYQKHVSLPLDRNDDAQKYKT